MTPLITREDIDAQAGCLTQLAQHLDALPQLNQLPSGRPCCFVGEGSSYHAVSWVLGRLRASDPERRFMLRYPWELRHEALQWPNKAGVTPYVIAISQSGKTASLKVALQHLHQQWINLEGLLITNADAEDLDKSAWAPLATFHLGLGEEHGIAATKTFSATAMAALALGNPAAARMTIEHVAPALLNFSNALRSNSAWEAVLAQCAACLHDGLVLVGHAGVMPLLDELHLKLTETLSRPVLRYHHEGFKHGPRAILHRERQQWPQVCYMVPNEPEAAAAFYADASLHLQHLDVDSAKRLRHLWLQPAGSAGPPEDLRRLGDCVIFGHSQHATRRLGTTQHGTRPNPGPGGNVLG